MQYLEEQIKLAGLKRIELDVFEFNSNAIRLYPKHVRLGMVRCVPDTKSVTTTSSKLMTKANM